MRTTYINTLCTYTQTRYFPYSSQQSYVGGGGGICCNLPKAASLPPHPWKPDLMYPPSVDLKVDTMFQKGLFPLEGLEWTRPKVSSASDTLCCQL